MVMRNVVQEKTSGPSQERAVNRSNRTSKESPLFVAIVSNSRIRMVQECQHDNPVVGELSCQLVIATLFGHHITYKVRNKVQLEEINEPDFPRPSIEDTGHNNETNIGSNDPLPLLRFE